VLKLISTQQNHCRRVLKVSWRGEELKEFNNVEAWQHGTRVNFFLVVSRRVACTCILGEWKQENAEREEADG
jgi:hypothetical protein